jgi:hypothetical protein
VWDEGCGEGARAAIGSPPLEFLGRVLDCIPPSGCWSIIAGSNFGEFGLLDRGRSMLPIVGPIVGDGANAAAGVGSLSSCSAGRLDLRSGDPAVLEAGCLGHTGAGHRVHRCWVQRDSGGLCVGVELGAIRLPVQRYAQVLRRELLLHASLMLY